MNLFKKLFTVYIECPCCGELLYRPTEQRLTARMDISSIVRADRIAPCGKDHQDEPPIKRWGVSCHNVNVGPGPIAITVETSKSTLTSNDFGRLRKFLKKIVLIDRNVRTLIASDFERIEHLTSHLIPNVLMKLDLRYKKEIFRPEIYEGRITGPALANVVEPENLTFKIADGDADDQFVLYYGMFSMFMLETDPRYRDPHRCSSWPYDVVEHSLRAAVAPDGQIISLSIVRNTVEAAEQSPFIDYEYFYRRIL